MAAMCEHTCGFSSYMKEQRGFNTSKTVGLFKKKIKSLSNQISNHFL